MTPEDGVVDAQRKTIREEIATVKRLLWVSLFLLVVMVVVWGTALPADRKGASCAMMLALGVNCLYLFLLWLVKHKARKLLALNGQAPSLDSEVKCGWYR